MKHGSLFSGIGGFDLAAERMGWNNAFHCEWNEFGQKVLKYYWPNAVSYGDITKTDFTIWKGQIDILTGGFPCQPYSQAGKRLGKEDDRHLWPAMLRAIREIQPTWVVGENVRGLTNWNGGMVFDEVQADLENEGYEVTPFLLPACAVNAPHRRDRVWFVGHSASNRWTRERKGLETENREQESGKSRIMEGGFKGLCSLRNVTNPSNEGLQGGKLNRSPYQEGQERGKQSSGPITKLHQIENWEQFPTQSPVCNGNDGISSRLDFDAVFEGIEHPRKPITFSKWRNESIKAGGNAIVHQVALQLFKAINQYDHTHRQTKNSTRCRQRKGPTNSI
jgi:DNA (cytosine-5)-methyltransferase 1